MASPADRAAGGRAETYSDDIVHLRELAQSPSAATAVEAVREFLDMEVAYISQITHREQVFGAMSGDGESFGVAEGESMPIEETYCYRVLSGRLPNLMADVRGDQRAASIAITEQAGVGAFVSVPVRFRNGSLYGTLCAASHETEPALGYRELQFLHVFARIIADGLERDANQRYTNRLEIQAAAAHTLVAAVQARDAYTASHSQEVVGYAVAVARRIGLDERQQAEVEQVALLHDIGKIAVPDQILRKPGSLNKEEWEVMRTHSAEGEELIRNTPGLEHLAPAIRAEHERWDGDGYPDGLRGEQIPAASRITFVCDAYQAMTSDRPYRRALTADAALREIRDGAGRQFCPTSTAAFIAVLEEGATA